MSYRMMLYTCKVKCYDGVTRTFERTGYFANTNVLRHRLAAWNGQRGPAGKPYQYFETSAQACHNDGTCCIPYGVLPPWKPLWHGLSAHQYDWKEA